jgi:hypothetical protein
VRYAAIALDLALRAHIAWFLAEVLLNPHDPRFEGKAIPIRNLIIVGGMSMLFPILHLTRRRGKRYPIWTDVTWLSLFWLDMAGNSFDLYDTYERFDLIPHFHGSGAATVAIAVAADLKPLPAAIAANVAHAVLELQEILTDVFAGTHNVRGPLDTIGDLAAGLLGSFAYAPLARALRRREGP